PAMVGIILRTPATATTAGRTRPGTTAAGDLRGFRSVTTAAAAAGVIGVGAAVAGEVGVGVVVAGVVDAAGAFASASSRHGRSDLLEARSLGRGRVSCCAATPSRRLRP